MGVGRGGHWPPWILKLLAKEFFFSNSRGKKQISPHLAPPEKKNWEKPLLAPLEKILPTPMCIFFHQAGLREAW